MEQGSPAGAGEGGGDGEDPVAEPFGFPPSGVVAGEAEELHPGGELGGESDQRAVLVEVVQGEVGQAGVLGVADPVFGARPAAVLQFEIGQLSAFGVGGERGDPVPVDVGQAGWAPGWGRSFRAITRIPVGQPVRSSSPVSSATQAPSRICPSLV